MRCVYVTPCLVVVWKKNSKKNTQRNVGKNFQLGSFVGVSNNESKNKKSSSQIV